MGREVDFQIKHDVNKDMTTESYIRDVFTSYHFSVEIRNNYMHLNRWNPANSGTLKLPVDMIPELIQILSTVKEEFDSRVFKE